MAVCVMCGDCQSALAASAESAAQRAGGVKTMAAAGAIGAVAGGLLLGPLGLVAGGAGAAYAATRGDKVTETTTENHT